MNRIQLRISQKENIKGLKDFVAKQGYYVDYYYKMIGRYEDAKNTKKVQNDKARKGPEFAITYGSNR